MVKVVRIVLLLLMTVFLAISGCTPEEAVQKALPGNSSFVGEWKMTRTSISPAPPVPDFIIGLFLRSSSTWKITGNPDTGLASKIIFDGRDVWYTIPRLGVQDLSVGPKPRIVNEKSGSEMVASGGGTITVKRVSLIGLPEFEDVVVNYTESIDMKIGEIDAVNNVVNADAVLRVQVAGGSYKADGQTRPITPYSATIVYTGVRPRR